MILHVKNLLADVSVDPDRTQLAIGDRIDIEVEGIGLLRMLGQV